MSYSVTDLGTLAGSMFAYGIGVNVQGQVVGYASVFGNHPSHTDRAFLAADGTVIDPGTLGGTASYASGINDAGVVAGAAAVTGTRDQYHAFLYQGNGPEDLGTLGGATSFAYGIDNAGDVVGYSDLASGLRHAFLYQDGVMTDLQAIDDSGFYGEALAVNDAGQAAGWVLNLNSGDRPALFEGGHVTELGTLGGDARATALNNRGDVVGLSGLTESTFPIDAFLYAGGTLTDLGTFGGIETVATGINDAGQVVGYGYTPDYVLRPFLYSDGQLTDLNTLIPPDSGWILYSAQAINQAGQIVGFGLRSGGIHPFLLTPDDHPGPHAPGLGDPTPLIRRPPALDSVGQTDAGAGLYAEQGPGGTPDRPEDWAALPNVAHQPDAQEFQTTAANRGVARETALIDGIGSNDFLS